MKAPINKNSIRESNTENRSSQRIKVKLDNRTTIMINRPSSLKVWKRLYPAAHIIK